MISARYERRSTLITANQPFGEWDLISPDNTASGVWADTAYRSKKNEAFLAKGMFTSNIHQRKPHRRPMPERIARANAKRSAVRSAVEHVFAGQKHRMGLIVRTIGVARARIKIGMAKLAYNFQRCQWAPKFPQMWALKIPYAGGSGER